MGKKNRKIIVNQIDIRITSVNETDFICITDMISAKDGDFFITDWIRNRNTLEFLATWESLNNPSFNYGEFATIRNKSGLNNFKISVSEWVDRTGAIGIIALRGRYGGTYAHEDIAMEFGTWISPQFKLYLITEFKRLKEIESNTYNLEWNVKRVLTKVNYALHTNAIQQYILPKLNIEKDKEWIEYAKEADLLNVALFGCTAKQWREANPQHSLEGKNIRDIASINQLAVLSNMESINSIMIQEGLDKDTRFSKLRQYALSQLSVLNSQDYFKSLPFESDSTYPIKAESEPATQIQTSPCSLRASSPY